MLNFIKLSIKQKPDTTYQQVELKLDRCSAISLLGISGGAIHESKNEKIRGLLSCIERKYPSKKDIISCSFSKQNI